MTAKYDEQIMYLPILHKVITDLSFSLKLPGKNNNKHV